MRGGNGLNHAETQPVPRPRPAGVQPNQPLEDALTILHGNARPIVAHAQRDLLRQVADKESHGGTARRMDQRIVEQVRGYSLKRRLIP